MTKIYSLLLISVILLIFSCNKKDQPKTYLPEKTSNKNLHVGDIVFDSIIDNPDFKICHRTIYQYYNFKEKGFRSGKKGIRKHFTDKFKTVAGTENENGYITIRFVVNCEGKTDRFRIFEIDPAWKDKKFHEQLTNQLLELTKQLQDWIPGKFEDSQDSFDYYQYLTFKISKGTISEILP